MLIKRIITATIAIPLVLACILVLPSLYFSYLVAALLLVGAWEWTHLIGMTKILPRIIYLVCITLGIFFSVWLPILPILSFAGLMWLWAFFAIFNFQAEGVGLGFQFPIVRSLIGFIVLVTTWVGLVTLHTQTQFGPVWLILVLCIIWGADIGGYFAGRFFGEKKLCARVSPNKTWAGFFGGLLLSLVISAMYTHLFLSLTHRQFFLLLVLTVITALFSVIGDLSVSLLKRLSAVKDSGNFFPGHGGVLDRLDSVAAASLAFVVLAYWFGL